MSKKFRFSTCDKCGRAAKHKPDCPNYMAPYVPPEIQNTPASGQADKDGRGKAIALPKHWANARKMKLFPKLVEALKKLHMTDKHRGCDTCQLLKQSRSGEGL